MTIVHPELRRRWLRGSLRAVRVVLGWSIAELRWSLAEAFLDPGCRFRCAILDYLSAWLSS